MTAFRLNDSDGPVLVVRPPRARTTEQPQLRADTTAEPRQLSGESSR